MERRSLRFASLLLALILLPAATSEAQQTAPTGSIRGKVTEKNGKEAVPYATVTLVGTRRSIATAEDGTFILTHVPVGTYTLKVMLLGRNPVARQVAIDAGKTVDVHVEIDKVVSTIVVNVVGKRDMINTRTSQTSSGIDRPAIDDTPVDDILDLVGTRSGVVNQGGALHIRGTRGDGFKMRLEGIEVNNPMFGGTPDIANPMIESAELLTGGVEAKYGEALGGILDIETREGRDRFGGEIQWRTDRYGESVKTFHNYDRLTLGFGGPTPLRGMTYFGTFEGTWQDTHLKSSRTARRRTLLDFIRLGNRQANATNSSFKLAWTRHPWKWTAEAIENRTITTPYDHMWSRNGYVSVTYDSSQIDAGAPPLPVFGRWSFYPEDSTFQAYNAADHVPTTKNLFRQWKTVWRHNLSKFDSYTLRLARNEFVEHTAVAGKEPWEYDTRAPFYWAGNENDNQYYATHGDFPVWRDRRSIVYTLRGDFMTNRWKNHLIQSGFEGRYNSFRNLALLFPNQEANGLPGLQRTDYRNENPEFSAYAQDRWEYEGLVLNVGARWDGFSPGAQIADSDLRDPQTGSPGTRFKHQVSPRVGVAYPISDRDVLSLHYGWLYQIPNRDFLFTNRGSRSTVPVRGNPNLEPQTNIEYQAAVQHLFSNDVAGQFAIFFRDMFGLINTRQMRDELTNLLVPVFVNEDYASSRGFEASIRKRMSHKFSTEVNYTYSISSGVASDPNSGLQFANGALLYLPISEQPLDWDQRHTLSATLVLREPEKWGLNLLWSYGSGLPFTPTFRNDRKPDPRLENSRRMPSQSTLSVVANKFFRVWNQKVTFFADARNLLNAKNINALTFGAFPNPFLNQVGDEYLIYYTETGRPGGAYLRDTNGDGREDWVTVNDPRVWQEGRSVRVGVGIRFGSEDRKD